MCPSSYAKHYLLMYNEEFLSHPWNTDYQIAFPNSWFPWQPMDGSLFKSIYNNPVI